MGKSDQIARINYARNLKHGHNRVGKRTKTYRCWSNMKSRCYNPNVDRYDNYGARGISVCDRWLESFDNFLEDMGEAPENMSIDRIDVNGDYCKDNCRWATGSDQQLNKTKAQGKSSKFIGVSYDSKASKWRARIQINKKCINLGYFNSDMEAKEAYDNKKRSYLRTQEES